MTGTLLLLGVIALVAGVAVGVLVRLWLGPRSAPGVAADLDLGLLETVALRPNRLEAELTARWLTAEKVRTTVASTPEGWRVLVFPDQADDAQRLLHAS